MVTCNRYRHIAKEGVNMSKGKLDIFNGDFDRSEVNGVVTLTYTDREVYGAGCELDKDVIKKLQDYDASYLSTATELAATKAEELMKKEKGVNKVIVDFPFTTNKKSGQAVVTSTRSKDVRVPASDRVITRSDVSLSVKDPYNKVTSSLIDTLQDKMTATLL